MRQGKVIETAEVSIAVDGESLCVALTYKLGQRPLTTICPQDLGNDWRSLCLTKQQMTNVYGLGQQFKKLGSANGDPWQVRTRGDQIRFLS